MQVTPTRPLHFVFRYKPLYEGRDTYQEHLRVEQVHGEVWWGNFGVGSAKDIVDTAHEQLRTGIPTFVFLQSRTRILHRGDLIAICGGGQHAVRKAPEPDLVPPYYRNRRCSLWFKLRTRPIEQPIRRQLYQYRSPALPFAAAMRAVSYVVIRPNVSARPSQANRDTEAWGSHDLEPEVDW